MFRDANDYYAQDKVYRAQKMRVAESERLGHQARSTLRRNFSITSAIQSHSRFWFAFLLAVLFILFSVTMPSAAHAQFLPDPGEKEPYSDAMAAYLVGNYYFIKGDYDRAVELYGETLEGVPQSALENSIYYAVIYWHLGDAQLMSGQYDEALASYQNYLGCAGDRASALETAYVQRLEQAINSGTPATVGLISE